MDWRKRVPAREVRSFSSILEQLAAIRGVDDLDEYLYPSASSLTDPYELDNMEDAVARIVEALDKGQKITVFMDFDNDGVCSGAIMVRWLRNFTHSVDYIVYERHLDHGLKDKEIPDTDLLIIVDSGTNDVKECKELKERGIDVVIIDHHLPSVVNDWAVIVNNQIGDYRSKALSGSGVVFKVIQALDAYFGTTYHQDFYDLAAIGIIGDIMSLREPENRYIVSQGLSNIVNPGIRKLLEKKKSDLNNLTSTTISFSIVPLVNAATRMNQIHTIVKLLLSDDFDIVETLADECIKLNDYRKQKQQIALDNLEFDNSRNIIFCVENELAGNLRGLIANQLANEYHKCAIVVKLNENTNIYEGSGRGYGVTDFKEMVSGTELVESAEGHSNAFGLRIHADKVEAFLNKCDELLDIEDNQYLDYDLELDADEVNDLVIKDIELWNRIAGRECEPIRVKVKDLTIYGRKVKGKNRNVVQLEGENVNLIKFNVADDYAENVGAFDSVDAIGVLGFNKWYHWGKKEWIVESQMIIDDFKLS